jgi:hypothetical protein
MCTRLELRAVAATEATSGWTGGSGTPRGPAAGPTGPSVAGGLTPRLRSLAAARLAPSLVALTPRSVAALGQPSSARGRMALSLRASPQSMASAGESADGPQAQEPASIAQIASSPSGKWLRSPGRNDAAQAELPSRTDAAEAGQTPILLGVARWPAGSGLALAFDPAGYSSSPSHKAQAPLQADVLRLHTAEGAAQPCASPLLLNSPADMIAHVRIRVGKGGAEGLAA